MEPTKITLTDTAFSMRATAAKGITHGEVCHANELKAGQKKGENKMNKAAAITNVVIVIIMVLLTHACYLKGKHIGADEIMSHIYPMSGIVTEVNRQEDRVVVTDSIGNEWEFDGAEDWHTGDIAAMIMEDNGTEEIYDDEIIDIQYDGWAE
jgi:hypothetical protein